jgi:DNA primase large subunit
MAETKMRGLRIPDDQLDEIDRRARSYNMKRTEYMIRAALEQLPEHKSTVERFEALEQRLERLESRNGQAAETP